MLVGVRESVCERETEKSQCLNMCKRIGLVCV